MILDDEYFMRQALVEADKALAADEVPIGAVIVANGKIIARAHNMVERLNDVTAHAEMMAFTAAAEALGGKYLKGCSLYVTLEPCVMCSGASYWTQIDRIVVGAKDEKRGFIAQGVKLHPQTEYVQGVLADECSEIIINYFRSKR
ncbi:MAG: nucleoside deaminase [Bacteroidota bacterium]